MESTIQKILKYRSDRVIKRPVLILIKRSIFFTIAILFYASFSFAQDIEKADSLIRILNEGGHSDSLRYNLLRDISEFKVNPEEKLFYSNQLIDFSKKVNNPKWLSDGYFLQGHAYRYKGDLHKATESYFFSLENAKKAQYTRNYGPIYGALGDVHSINKDHKNSLFYYKKSIEFLRSDNQTKNLASVILNLGDEFYQIDEFDSAFTYFMEAKQIFEEINSRVGIAYSLGNIGIVYIKKGQISLGESNINEAISILNEVGDVYPVAVYYISIADIYRDRGDLNKAILFSNQSLDISIENGLKEQISDANLKLSELYAQIKEYEKAYNHHSQYVVYRDSINNEEVIRKMADLRTKFEVSQKQAEIDLLTKQRQINKLIGLGLVFITLFLAALAFILLRNNRLKQTTNQMLSSQKDELQHQHHKLETLNSMKDRFFSIISHDLRGPVNAFNGISELIKHYIAKNEMGQLREVSEYIDKSARQLSTLLDNLLEWAIKQQGAFPFHPEKLPLSPLLEEIADMFGITAHAKNVILTVNVEEEIIVWADRNSLATILRNLVNNALKFTEPEGLVTISAYIQNNYALINIIDTGIGIPEEQLENIFTVKDKLPSRGTAGEKGLGIGLRLAYEFALMNKGTIIVNSEEKAGTIFTVKIPVFDEAPKTKKNGQEKVQNNIKAEY